MRRLALFVLCALILGGLLALRGKMRTSGPWGYVIGHAGPVAGARVRLRGTASSTTTDASGRFRLPAAPGRRVTAAADGFLIAGARGIDAPLNLRLTPLPREDNPEYEWVDPAPDPAGSHNCGNCHTEIYREWADSAHGHSARGFHFRDLYDGTDRAGKVGVSWGLLQQHPLGAGVCSSCHAPALRDDDPAYYDLRQIQGTARHGVHCDFCHKITGPGEGTLGLSHGRFNLRLLRPGQGQLFFGALDDVDRNEDAYSPFYRESRYCASCHEGIVFGVPVYTTYSEWLDSPARRQGKQCQDCHMTPTGRMTNIAPRHGGIRRDPQTLANHRFFDGSQADMLRRCLEVAAVFEPPGDAIRARLHITADGAGHRVPTGFVDRHLILIADGQDARGRPLRLRQGPTLPAAAGSELGGKPGRLYAKFLTGEDGRGPVPFWSNAPDVTDNRLTPGQPDEAVWTFPAELARLRVRIVYRRFWHEVARAKGWPDEDLVVFDRVFARR
jgi:hypothetical protein